jgi:hypothetical protein
MHSTAVPKCCRRCAPTDARPRRPSTRCWRRSPWSSALPWPRRNCAGKACAAACRAYRPLPDTRRLLHLAEDLRFAQHHGIQARCDAEHVAHRILLRMLVKIGLDLLRRQCVVLGQPVCRTLRVLGRTIQLGAVARGQDRGFAYRLGPQQVVKGLTHARRVERHLLANRERGRMVVDAQSEQLHGDMTLKRDEKFRQGVLETDRAQTTRRQQEGRTPARKPGTGIIPPGGSVHREPGQTFIGSGTVCARHQAPPAQSAGAGPNR